MIRLLIIISVVGLILSTVCISAAAAIGGREVMTKGWTWSDWAIRVNEETDDVYIGPAEKGQGGVFVNGERVDDNDTGDYSAFWVGAEETREFVWSGASEIEMGMPADVTYTQGPTPRVVVTGPKAAIDRFYVDEERFRLRGWRSSNTFSGIPSAADLKGARPPRLKIEVTAPGVTRFDFSGTETLDIRNYSQDSLTLDFSGASKVTGQGSARLLVLDLSGAAEANLAALSVDQLSADLSGAARATAAPNSSANIDASGASRVALTTRPRQVNSDLSGAAQVEYADAATAAPSPAAPPAAKTAAAPPPAKK
jgi:hypothetical protein